MKFAFLKNIFLAAVVVSLFSCSSATKLKSVETTSIELNPQAVDDLEFEKTINPYKSKMDGLMNEVLIVSDQPLTKGLPESNLGDFVSDVMLKQANKRYKADDGHPVDLFIMNNGGLRTEFPKGNITRGHVFTLMPFENSLVILTLSGEKTKQLFEFIVKNNGFPFAGGRITAEGKNIKNIKVNGKDFDESKTYKVATIDFIVMGEAEKYYFFKDPIKLEPVNYILRDALIDYLAEENKKGHTLNVSIDGRIKLE